MVREKLQTSRGRIPVYAPMLGSVEKLLWDKDAELRVVTGDHSRENWPRRN